MSNQEKSEINEALLKRVIEYRNDFKQITGKDFETFFCPITYQDEDLELCKAHITNSAVDSPNDWVPQVKYVDNFFGSILEADFVAYLQDRGTHPVDLLCDAKKRTRHSIYFTINGEKIDSYMPKEGHRRVSTHTYAKFIDENKIVLREVALKINNDQLPEEANLQIILEGDLRSNVIGSVLKAAHLTMFKLQRYQYVFSEIGLVLATILRNFYLKYSNQKTVSKNEIDKYFLKFSNLCMPIYTNSTDFLGTSNDHKVLFCKSMNHKFFALGVLVKFKEQLYCTYIPADKSQFELYESFIKEPPVSIQVLTGKFCIDENTLDYHWEIFANSEKRVYLPHSGKTPEWVENQYGWVKPNET